MTKQTGFNAGISFEATQNEYALIQKIVDRVFLSPDLAPCSRKTLVMDLLACNANGCALDLERLLNAHMYEFWHDIAGIVANIDRKTGKLGVFLPRFARNQ